MLPSIRVLAGATAWCVLAFKVVKLGREGNAVIFRNWTDVALTAVVVGCLFVPILGLILTLPWLWMTAAANRRRHFLLVVVPAKLPLVDLGGVYFGVSVLCANAAVASRDKISRRAVRAGVAVCTAGIAFLVFRTIRRSIQNNVFSRQRQQPASPGGTRMMVLPIALLHRTPERQVCNASASVPFHISRSCYQKFLK